MFRTHDGASFFILASEKYINKKTLLHKFMIFGYNLYVDKPINTLVSFINCIKIYAKKYNIS